MCRKVRGGNRQGSISRKKCRNVNERASRSSNHGMDYRTGARRVFVRGGQRLAFRHPFKRHIPPATQPRPSHQKLPSSKTFSREGISSMSAARTSKTSGSLWRRGLKSLVSFLVTGSIPAIFGPLFELQCRHDKARLFRTVGPPCWRAMMWSIGNTTVG